MSGTTTTRIRTASLLTVVALSVAGCGSSGSTTAPTTTTASNAVAGFTGYVRTPPLQVGSVSLPDVDGAPVQMVGPEDGFLIVFFGFASCPDICPMTLTNLKAALAQRSKGDRARIDVAVVTVDPSRDTPELFGDYVAQYFPEGHAIRTDDPKELRSAADRFGATYRVKTNAQGQREVIHSGDLYVIDHTGTVVLAWPFGVTPEDLDNDLGLLLAGDRPPTQENRP